jgi:hypothetical protein
VNGRFQDVSAEAGPSFHAAGYNRGAAFADFDGDGKVDVVVSVLNGPAHLFRNVTADAGHWLAVKLVGTRSNRDGLGAELQAVLPDGTVLYNHATTSVGYASSSEPLVRFGLGKYAKLRELRISWPGGGAQVVQDVAADRVVEIRETVAGPVPH